MSRYYCHSCRRSLSPKNFDLEKFEGLSYRLCKRCEELFMVFAERVLDSETAIRLLLMEREGGESEVVVPIGRVDLVTDDYVIEIKHLSKWMDSLKVLLYAAYFPDKKPRVHLFGTYTQEVKDMIERQLSSLDIVVTWEREAFTR